MTPSKSGAVFAIALAMLIHAVASACLAQQRPSKPKESGGDATPRQADLKRLSPEYDVWLDSANRRVVMLGRVCLRQGPLELLACLEGTKEHEAILAIRTKAFVVHSALLAVGAEPGSPVRFQPEYAPATGPAVEVTLFWTDAQRKRRQSRGQDWVKYHKTGRAMDHPWVFAGSAFWQDPTSGEKFYQAEDGDLICVSNFPSALLDLPIESSQANAELLFEAFTDRIPPLGTRVWVVLTPRIEKKDSAKADKS